jgi:uncharacterized membrane protein
MTDKVLEIIAIAFMLYGIVEVLLNWSTLPQQIPTHFDAAGNADGWGSKGTIWLLPAIVAVLIPSLLLLRRFPWLSNAPIKITEDNAEHQYALIVRLLSLLACLVSFMFLTLLLDIISIAGGGTSLLGAWMLPVHMIPIACCIIWYVVSSIRSAKHIEMS